MLLRIPRSTTVQARVCMSGIEVSFLQSIRAVMSLFILPIGILHTLSSSIWKKNWTTHHFLLYRYSVMDFDQPIFQKECEYTNCLFKESTENINRSFCWGIILLSWFRTYYMHIQGELTFQFNEHCNLCNKIRKRATV